MLVFRLLYTELIFPLGSVIRICCELSLALTACPCPDHLPSVSWCSVVLRIWCYFLLAYSIVAKVLLRTVFSLCVCVSLSQPAGNIVCSALVSVLFVTTSFTWVSLCQYANKVGLSVSVTAQHFLLALFLNWYNIGVVGVGMIFFASGGASVLSKEWRAIIAIASASCISPEASAPFVFSFSCPNLLLFITLLFSLSTVIVSCYQVCSYQLRYSIATTSLCECHHVHNQ